MKIQKMLSIMRKGVTKYKMIADGDKIAVGISGGKDSTIVATDSDGRAAINAQGGNVILDNVVLKAKTSSDTTDVIEMQSEPTCLKISNKGAVTATNCTIKAEISRPYAVQVYEDC